MTWQALRMPDGLSRRMGSGPLPSRMERGTLMLELDLAEFAKARGPVFQLFPDASGGRVFSLEPRPDGRLHLLRRQGTATGALSIGMGREPISGLLRLTYHWDCRQQRSLITAENLTRGTIRQQEVRGALPLLACEIEALVGRGAESRTHPVLEWLALADHWQTVGPTPGLAPSTRVATPDGPRPVSALRPGDLVMTVDHGALPVLWQGKVMLPSLGSLRQVRLCAPYFGLDRDLVLQAGQRIAVSGADVEYLFGEEEVLIEAAHLVNGRTAHWEEEGRAVASHGILLDRHALIEAEGVPTESVYLGGLARLPALAQSTAPGHIASLPRHSAPVRRELMEFEARALQLARLRSRAPIAA